MKLSLQQRAFSKDMMLFLIFAHNKGFEVTFGEFQRPQLMQDHYLKTGASTVKYSNHQDKLAGDLNFFLNDKYITDKKTLQPLGDFWESLNPLNEWGGNWKSFVDCPHFERKRI